MNLHTGEFAGEDATYLYFVRGPVSAGSLLRIVK